MKRLVLESIEGVEIYPIISLIIFLLLFIVALVYTLGLDKNFIQKMGNMPLLTDDQNENSHEEA